MIHCIIISPGPAANRAVDHEISSMIPNGVAASLVDRARATGFILR